MDAARWQRILAAFSEVLEHPPDERAAALASACGGDHDLKREVERLLESHARAADFLETPPVPGVPVTDAGDAAIPSRIGSYRVERELGRGGMGTVYLAEREDGGFRKRVALKVVRRGMDSQFVLRRFHTERQILAALEHPDIARLHDGGSSEEGLPYFVMEYVAGESLIAYCDARQLPIPDRLRLFRRVCNAVQYAHQSLVVHRDLKPSNILVTEQGDPKLLDFGIAKLLEPQLGGEEPAETGTVMRLMTPEYASPEQIRGERVTTASDVYSLGVILYELLCGRRPYRLKSRQAAEMERALLEQEPPAPSAAVTDPKAPARLRRLLRGDLDNIVMKALQRDTARRYATAAELGEDIERHLEGRPVRARPDTRAYRAMKFARRHRMGVAATGVALVSLLTGLGVALGQARVARLERMRAERRFNDVRKLANSVVFEMHDAIQFLPGATAARQLMVTRSLEYVDSLAQEAPRDVDLRRELAAAYKRLADVQGDPMRANLGDMDGALKSYRKAQGMRESLVSEVGGDPRDVFGLIEVEFQIAALLRDKGELPAAARTYGTVVTLLEPLVASPHAPREAYATLMAGYHRLAEVNARLGRGGEAAEVIERAIGFGERVVRERPEDWRLRLNLSAVYGEQGNRLASEGRYPEALSRVRAARATLEPLLAKEPLNTQYQRSLLFALNREGRILERLGERQPAIRAYKEQLRVATEMSQRDPRDRFGQLAFAIAARSLGTALFDAGETAGGIRKLREARHVVGRVVAEDPSNAYARDEVASIDTRLGRALLLEPAATARTEGCHALASARNVWRALEAEGALPAESLADLPGVEEALAGCAAPALHRQR